MKEPQRQLQRDAKQEVIKHSAAIQIENNLTLLQRRAWNAPDSPGFSGKMLSL